MVSAGDRFRAAFWLRSRAAVRFWGVDPARPLTRPPLAALFVGTAVAVAVLLLTGWA